MSSKSESTDQPLISHLIELRSRILRIACLVLLLFLVMIPFANAIFDLLARPLLNQVPGGLIAIGPASTFLVPLKFVFILACFLCMPWILYQIWAFIAPGLYAKEKKLALPLIASSILLFYLGVLFAYFLVLPMAFKFFQSVAPSTVSVMNDISYYHDFVLNIFFAFGFAFEVPIITILLILARVVSVETLTAKRRYVIVLAFVISAVITPPDVASQILLALPMWFLFELGLLFGRWIEKERATQYPTVSE